MDTLSCRNLPLGPSQTLEPVRSPSHAFCSYPPYRLIARAQSTAHLVSREVSISHLVTRTTAKYLPSPTHASSLNAPPILKMTATGDPSPSEGPPETENVDKTVTDIPTSTKMWRLRTNPLQQLLTAKFPILESKAVRAGYAIACIAAALAGAHTLALSGAFFCLLSVLTGAPTPLTSMAAVIVAIFLDISRTLTLVSPSNDVLGTGNGEGLGFAIYIGILALVIFVDDDVEIALRPGQDVDSAALRLDQAKNAERAAIEARERAKLQRELGLDSIAESRQRFQPEDNLRGETMQEWDERLGQLKNETGTRPFRDEGH